MVNGKLQIMNDNAGFELHGLRKLFATSNFRPGVPESSFKSVKMRESVAAEVERIKRRLLENVLAIEVEKAARRYVRVHQYALIAVMDKIFADPAKRRACVDCYGELEELLLFLQEHFPGYFDDRANAPMTDIEIACIDFAASLPELDSTLQLMCDRDIAEMILGPLKKFCWARTYRRVSIGRLRQLRHILKHARRIVNQGWALDDLTRETIELLVYLNYNSKRTFLKMTNHIRGLLSGDMDVDKKVEYLSYLLKVAGQASVKPGMAYHARMPTLKMQLVDYITRELEYLMNVSKSPKDVVPTSDDTNPLKIKFSLSVPQLGYLLRLLMDNHVITNSNVLPLIRFVALNSESKQVQHISWESLRNKFYDIEDETRQSLRKILVQLLKRAEGSGGDA